jgi:tRNA(Ile)-lysidine synthase
MTAQNTSPATMQVRHGVRTALANLQPADLVLVACSGGPDSMALAKAVSLEAPLAHIGAGAIVVDHGWSQSSQEVVARTVVSLETMGLAPVLTAKLPPHEKSETAARDLRYAAISQAAAETSARAVFLGHTQDDQAETLLMRLARGSGTKSLAGIPPKRDIFVRPLLGVSRQVTHEACQEWSLVTWQDPANFDTRHTRVRVRQKVLHALADALGEGVAQGLARSANLLRDDAEVLDGLAAQTFDLVFDQQNQTLNAEKLAAEQPAISRRVLLNWVSQCGVPKAELTFLHASQLQSLLSREQNSTRVALPAKFTAWRDGTDLRCEMVSP